MDLEGEIEERQVDSLGGCDCLLSQRWGVWGREGGPDREGRKVEAPGGMWEDKVAGSREEEQNRIREREERVTLVGDALSWSRFLDTQVRDHRQSGGIWGLISSERAQTPGAGGNIQVVKS